MRRARWGNLAFMELIRRIGRFLFLVFVVCAAVVACQDQRNSQGADLRARETGALRLATYNVHYILANQQEGRWGLSRWEARKEPLADTVRLVGADIIAFQEMESFRGGNDDSNNLARSYLLKRNPRYEAAAVGDWRTFPSTQPIFYLRGNFSVLDEGWFFFSETPDQIYSRTFDGSYPAFASWAQFRRRGSGAVFRVVNLHTDYASGENRRRSIDLVAERISPWIDAGETVFVMGDLNARFGSDLHARLRGAGLGFVPIRGATYHMDIGLNLFAAIDHIGYAGAEADREAMVFREKLGAVWPTDHYPVVADFFLPQ